MKFFCPHCSQRLEIPDEYAGTDAACPACGKPIRVPDGAPSSAASPVCAPARVPERATTRGRGAWVLVALLAAGLATSVVVWRHRPPGRPAAPPPATPNEIAPAPTPGPTGSSPAARTVDTLIFGQAESERAHALKTGWGPVTPKAWVGTWTPPSDPSTGAPSDVVTGALGESARRLLPRTPDPDIYGGEVTFQLAVDPRQQNYFTLKLWGSDASGGRWFILDVDGRELGLRHGGDAAAPDILNNVDVRWAPNRFVYRTVALPFHLTQGRAHVLLRLRSLGWLNDYDGGQYYGAYQKLMREPSLALYRAYTHVGSWPDLSGEPQGRAPDLKSPRDREREDVFLARVKSNVNGRLARLMRAKPEDLRISDLRFLGECFDAHTNHGQSWIVVPDGKPATALAGQVALGVDAQVRRQSADDNYVASQGNDSWGGAFGPLGDAIRLVWPCLRGVPALQAAVDFGGRYGRIRRQTGWAMALRASVDHGRFHRRAVANQEYYCVNNLYRANRALQLLDPARALREPDALRYIREALGLAPFRGSDGPGDGPVPTMGTGEPYDWRVITRRGTSKDLQGFPGSDYGELGGDFYALAQLTGDTALKARALEVFRARCVFRFPGPDGDGFLVMQGPNPIGVRNNTLPGHYAYLGRGGELHAAAEGAAAIGADLLGYAQQAIADGQLFRMIGDHCDDPYLPMRYAAVRALPPTGLRLPMSPGAPDFAWADEENMVVAAKHGEERFFANLFWREPDAINGWAKVFQLTEEAVHIADVQVEDVRYRPTGRLKVLGPRVEKFDRAQPPDQPTNAYSGVAVPVGMRSDLAEEPSRNLDGGRATGYTLRYGHWLVGINAHHADTYRVVLPSDFTTAHDLISARSFTGEVVLGPMTSAVFYLPEVGDAQPRPVRPLTLVARSGPGVVGLAWSPAPSADRYRVKRADAEHGPFAVIADDVAGTEYADLQAGSARHWYTVSGVNTNGEGADSMAVGAAPPDRGLLNRAPAAVCTASSAYRPEPAAAATDGDVATKWNSSRKGEPAWLQVDFGAGVAWTVARYELTSANDIPGRDPASWRLLGSTDGRAWTVLDVRAGQRFPARFAKQTFTLARAAPYRYYRLQIDTNQGGRSHEIQLAEWSLIAER